MIGRGEWTVECLSLGRLGSLGHIRKRRRGGRRSRGSAWCGFLRFKGFANLCVIGGGIHASSRKFVSVGWRVTSGIRLRQLSAMNRASTGSSASRKARRGDGASRDGIGNSTRDRARMLAGNRRGESILWVSE